jgi:hypothetical protein
MLGRFLLVAAAAVLALLPCPAPGCSLCTSVAQAPTFRQEAAQVSARIIVYGSLANPQVKGGGNGTTDLLIEAILRDDPALADKRKLELPRYVPVNDPKNPPRFLVFCDVFMGKLDPYRGVPIKDPASVVYLRKALTLDARDRTASLLFYFDYLDAADPEVARDAFLEFAKATDQEIGRLAPRLSADRLRKWVQDPKTAPERLGLYSFLLGGCGQTRDAALLRSLLADTSERVANAYDGILSGLIHLDPREGWSWLQSTLRDGKKPLFMRLTVVRTLRFYHGWQPQETRSQVLNALAGMLDQGELADLAIEDLRRWQMWDLTSRVLALAGRKGFDSPLMQRAVVRYALACDDGACRQFVAARRRADAELVKDVEEALQLEKGK